MSYLCTHPKFQSQCESFITSCARLYWLPFLLQPQPGSCSAHINLLGLTQVNQPHRPQAAVHAETDTGFTCALFPMPKGRGRRYWALSCGWGLTLCFPGCYSGSNTIPLPLVPFSCCQKAGDFCLAWLHSAFVEFLNLWVATPQSF